MALRLPCRVREVIAHGDHVYSVLLEPRRQVPRFLPGQFLHLALDPYRPGDFWPDSRVFSIASSPADTSLLRIAYAVKGSFTSRMEQELQAGGDIWVKLPYGEFVVAEDQDVCLLAGGTGVTAFTAFLSSRQAALTRDIYIIYGARRPELLIYRSLVEEAAKRCPRVHAHLFSEQLTEEDSGLERGSIDLECVFRLIGCPPASLAYYIAGPPGMIRDLSTDLRSRAIPDRCIFVDAWE